MVRYLCNNHQKTLVTIHGENYLATCLGHRFGTGCTHRSRSRQMRHNWNEWQLCYKCARKLHPEFYKNKKNHGVKPFPSEEKYSKVPFNLAEMPSVN